MEFIGDSETCGYGNEGAGSSSNGIVGMKGRFENVYNCYACITARMFNAEAHILAWSGKGPEVVVVNLGTQDLFPPASSKDEIVEAYTALLKDIRMCMIPASIEWSNRGVAC
ncbi:unnamed protein product [Aphanomyces euteiches]